MAKITGHGKKPINYENPLQYISSNKKENTNKLIKMVANKFNLREEEAKRHVVAFEKKKDEVKMLNQNSQYLDAVKAAYKAYLLPSIGHIYINSVKYKSPERKKVFEFMKSNNIRFTQTALGKLDYGALRVFSQEIKDEIEYLKKFTKSGKNRGGKR